MAQVTDVGGLPRISATAYGNERAIEFLPSSDANMYPDPDDMPTYPWLGLRTSGASLQAQEPSASLTSGSNTPSICSIDDTEFDMNDEILLPSGKDPNDPLADPDFQYHEEAAE